ncbi:MAG: hypothetical protein JSV56_10135 [Methanomassiliicoccales archaeon]|nr:MAG: hypothetical protein JSV56_10135 [Methanomassiliicoccales archaeon]
MNEKPVSETNVEQSEDEARVETHCYVCQQELPDGIALINSKCGVNFHDDCAKRVVRCPACGENLLEHFLNEEAKKKIFFKDRIYTILIFLIPFVLIEILIGIWSIVNHPSHWSIPPWLGLAFFLDLIILVVGIVIALIMFLKLGYIPEKKTISALVLAKRGPTPGKAEEQLYACGYGDRANPFLLGDVSIPNKVGVQRENVVRVGVDRLTMTPEGTYVWLNPRFLKLLPPKTNPQPSNPEELEQVWKATGRTKIVSEEGAAKDEEKLCANCNSPLEYIADYDAWYCTSCGAYDESSLRPDLPPPDEVFPPKGGA